MVGAEICAAVSSTYPAVPPLQMSGATDCIVSLVAVIESWKLHAARPPLVANVAKTEPPSDRAKCTWDLIGAVSNVAQIVEDIPEECEHGCVKNRAQSNANCETYARAVLDVMGLYAQRPWDSHVCALGRGPRRSDSSQEVWRRRVRTPQSAVSRAHKLRWQVSIICGGKVL